MKKLFTFLTISIILSSIYAQDEAKTFKPSGKPFIKVFTNFHSTFTNGKTTHSAFEIQRAYLGYAVKLSEKFSGKVTLDVGDPKDGGKLQMTAYLKNAYFQYKSGRLTTKFGLIGTAQFALQDKQWGGRYLYKSFQNKYKFGSSADLGVYAKYKIHDIVSVDITISNGDGYKSLEMDSILKYAAGVTLTPAKGLNIRGYYDIMGSDSTQQTISFYAGYTKRNLKIGAEYNMQSNYKMINKHDRSGISLYGSYKFKTLRIFSRYDYLSSVKIGNAADPWNYGKDGQSIIAGVEFFPVKGIKISPNYQNWIPADGSVVINGAYVSCEIKF